MSANNNFTGRNTFSGNTIIGSTVDSGEKLQVTGMSKFTGNVNIFSSGSTDLTISTSGSVSFPALNFRYNTGSPFAKIELNISSGEFKHYTATGHWQSFYSNNLERMRIPTSGNLILGSITDIPSAILNINSTTKGFLMPRMTEAQKNAISAPAVGLHIYQLNATEGVYVFKSTGWAFAY